MTVMLSLHAGYDVEYLTGEVGTGGVDYYLSAAGQKGEPPGEWAGKGAEALGLRGQVDADVMRALYHEGKTPDGRDLGVANKPHTYAGMEQTLEARIEAEIAARIAELGTEPTEVERQDLRLMVASKQRNSVPFFDFTLSATKSISVAHAAYCAAAKKARDDGDEAEAARCTEMAARIENAMREGARQVVRSIERSAAYVRTGHHGGGTGQWRDASGVTAAMFLQHTSRDGDPQLHVHTAVLNRAQRADGADAKFRTLDSRSLHRERLGIAARAGMVVEQQLQAAGLSLVQREDGNGREIEGVSPATMRAFSSRRTAITPALQELVSEYTDRHGRAPSRRALWSLRQQATLETRKSKHEVQRTAAESLDAWEETSRATEVQILADVRAAIEEFGASSAPAAPCTADMHRAIRIAVHEVQRQNATWSASQLAWELFRAMPPRTAETDAVPMLEAMLTEALTTDICDVIPLAPAPDVTDVSMLGVRASDGASVYRPPGEARYCTSDHLDTEDYLITSARRRVRQQVSDEQAAEAVEDTGLSAGQAEVVKGLLTTTTAVTVLAAPPGTGKSYVMARFAEAFERLTGRRVIGLTASTNAARILRSEGLALAYNIAEFLGKIKDSTETRGHKRVDAGDVLVIDEASQVSTADMLALRLVAERCGATIIATGDPAQLSSVDAGGIVAEIARQQGSWRLHEVRRFTRAWEAAASLALHAGNMSAWGEYRAHGHVRAGTQREMYAKAVRQWATDYVAGKDVLLLAGSNAEAAELARLARDTLIAWRRLPGHDDVVLSDGNEAGRGDVIRARLNAKDIEVGGRTLANRDTLRITGINGYGKDREIVVQRRERDGSWSDEFTVTEAYVTENTELSYAGNVFVAQGASVDSNHLLVSNTLSRESGLVGMTRGRDANTAYVVTGQDGQEQAPAEAVLGAMMDREAAQATATQTIREAQAFPASTRHLFELWRALIRQEATPGIDREVARRMGAMEFQRFMTDPQRPVVHRQLRQLELAGHDVGEVLDQATRAGWGGAQSIAATLHGRVEKLQLGGNGGTETWAQRTPRPREAEAQADAEADPAPKWRLALDEVVRALDHRQLELGLNQLENPEPWAVRYLGMPPKEAGALRDDWLARAAQAASYREAAGHDDPEQAVGPVPKNNPELYEAYQAAVRALQMEQEETTRSLPRGALEARVEAYERVKAWAPPAVGKDLEMAAQAERDAAEQAAAARETGDVELAEAAGALEQAMTADRERLEVQRAARLEWEEATQPEREAARAARSELERRGHDEPGPAPERESHEYDLPDIPVPEMEARESEAEFLERLQQMVDEAERDHPSPGRQPEVKQPEVEQLPGPVPDAEFERQLEQLVADAEGRAPREPEPVEHDAPARVEAKSEAEFRKELDELVAKAQQREREHDEAERDEAAEVKAHAQEQAQAEQADREAQAEADAEREQQEHEAKAQREADREAAERWLAEHNARREAERQEAEAKRAEQQAERERQEAERQRQEIDAALEQIREAEAQRAKTEAAKQQEQAREEAERYEQEQAREKTWQEPTVKRAVAEAERDELELER